MRQLLCMATMLFTTLLSSQALTLSEVKTPNHQLIKGTKVYADLSGLDAKQHTPIAFMNEEKKYGVTFEFKPDLNVDEMIEFMGTGLEKESKIKPKNLVGKSLHGKMYQFKEAESMFISFIGDKSNTIQVTAVCEEADFAKLRPIFEKIFESIIIDPSVVIGPFDHVNFTFTAPGYKKSEFAGFENQVRFEKDENNLSSSISVFDSGPITPDYEEMKPFADEESVTSEDITLSEGSIIKVYHCVTMLDAEENKISFSAAPIINGRRFSFSGRGPNNKAFIEEMKTILKSLKYKN